MAHVMERHPGDAEADAAIAGMREVYGRPLPDVDQWVTGEAHGKRFSGRVGAAEPGRVTVEIDGGWIVVPPSAIDQQ